MNLRVFKNVTVPLLSRDGCKALGLIGKDWPRSTVYQSSEDTGQVGLGTSALSTGQNKAFLPPPKGHAEDSDSIKDDLIHEMSEVFSEDSLRAMEGPPMHISLVEGAVPCKRFKPFTIPYHWRDKVRLQLDGMLEKGIIEAVPVGEAIDWCHPMVVVPKKGSSEPRITVDLTGLNKFVRRPAYPTKVPREVVARIPPGNKYFSTLDSRHGYWQVKLDEPSSKLTTFITPWGCFRFLRNVMGLSSAGDEHNRRGDDTLLGIENVEKLVEDILIYDTSFQDHVTRVRKSYTAAVLTASS